ncbi:MAG TPA: hypothetical protein VE965_07525 [Gammaproteobacteria bacterium]|nr:hypothetical protein [Gammaproteobacteria bacterium]
MDKSHAAARRRKLLTWAPVLLVPLAGIAFLGDKTISLEKQKQDLEADQLRVNCTLCDLSRRWGGKLLFTDINVAIHPGYKVLAE